MRQCLTIKSNIMGKTFKWNSTEGYTKEQLLEMGFTFTLNGDIVTPNEESKHLKEYLDYRKQKLIDTACAWLDAHWLDDQYWSADGEDFYMSSLIMDLRKVMEE